MNTIHCLMHHVCALAKGSSTPHREAGLTPNLPHLLVRECGYLKQARFFVISANAHFKLPLLMHEEGKEPNGSTYSRMRLAASCLSQDKPRFAIMNQTQFFQTTFLCSLLHYHLKKENDRRDTYKTNILGKKISAET